MDWSLRKIRAKQIEKELSVLKNLIRPVNGWVKTIRETLGMNTRQLGQRCNVTSERIIRIEADEIEGRTTIATLEKIAEALNCRLVYGFVPNTEMIEFLKNTAKDKAKEQLKRISHYMALEDQKLSYEAFNEQVEILQEELLSKKIKNIWDK